MKSLDEFLQHINIYAPGCAVPTAHFGIRQAAIEFCERTRLWRFEDYFEVPGADAESIFAPANSVVHKIEAAWFDGQKLEPKTVDWLDAHCDGWRDGSLTGQPKYITQTEPNTLRIVPAAPGTVSLSLFLKPSQDADELPDFMADQYRTVIANGALSYILVIPNQSFTNMDMANGFGATFQAKLAELSREGSTGQQRARTRTRGTFF
jgi:hypothetical protein